ncbi:MAG: RNA polymerase factor sigma-54 [Salinisphaeraceae bacterium]|nr:RNA polymerase factor sigma-54 [Salinisphaeraceae bacterium]
MKNSQIIQQNQQLAMTPQLLQQIRLLQLSRLELEQTLQTALETNVLLEAEDELQEADIEADSQESSDDDKEPDEIFDAYEACWDTPTSSGPLSEDYDPVAHLAEPEQDLYAKLQTQVLECFGYESDRAIAIALIDACDESGYLTQDFRHLARHLSESFNTTPRHIEQILKQVQNFDPLGYAARSLCECLSIQLQALSDDCQGKALALRIVNEDLSLLSTHQPALIAAQFDASEADARAAEQLVLSLDPKPGEASNSVAQGIFPDVIVRRSGNQWKIDLARERLPKLRVNRVYERMLSTDQAAGGHEALRDQLNEARWIVRGLEIRNDTLSRAAEVIFTRQQRFLEQGIEGLAPLTLREVADAIGMHESTVCRITNNKYVQTPRGVFELKTFFSSQLNRKDGSEIAGAAVKAMVRKIIDKEDRSRPMSDSVIAQILARKGICIARRTVAKYREAMDIAPVRERARQAKAESLHGGVACHALAS